MREFGTTLALAALLVVASASVASFARGQDAATTATERPDLDLREANVVGVEFESAGTAYDFSVTLYHDDDGESGYADWWQVETLNGSELGRRDLLHAHGTEPFTRSERVEVPENVSLVVVRGHDQTHDYGGQAMVVDLRTGATETLRQGSERRNFDDCEVVADENRTAETTTVAETTTATVVGTATAETDLVRCPWEGRANATTTE